MEVTKIGASSIKIKGKNVSLLVDPVGRAEGEIILNLMSGDNADYTGVTGSRLVIDGPGEYEAGGMSLTVKKIDGVYSAVVTEQERLLLFPTSVLGKIADDDEYTAIILHVDTKVTDDAFASLNAKSVILYGNLEEATIKSENQEKVSRVNLKKDAGNGKIFLLV